MSESTSAVKFLNVSAVKKLAHGMDRQCSPEFVEALDAFVSATIRKSCEQGDKRLGESSVIPAPKVSLSKTAEVVHEIKTEAVCAELQINTRDREGFLKSLDNIKTLCDQLLVV